MQIKQHLQELLLAKRSGYRGLNVPWVNQDLVVPADQIFLRKDNSSRGTGHRIQDTGNRIPNPNGTQTESAVIPAGLPLTIGLKCNMKRGRPLAAGWLDNAELLQVGKLIPSNRELL